MFYKRHQDLWKTRANNSNLIVNPQQSDVQNIYSFCENFNDRLSEFVYTSMQIAKHIKCEESALIIDNEDNLFMVIEILKQQRFIFLDTISQIRGSYKGYVSWILIGTNSRLYLIDSARLHDQCHGLKDVLERKDLIKFTHECQQVLFAMKRDWQIFIPNIFDLEVIQRYLAKKGKNNLQPKTILKQFVSSSGMSINCRPIRPAFLVQVQNYFESEINLLLNMDKFFATEDQEYQCYAYFNHYDFLLKSYFHHCSSVRQVDELERMRHGVNAFSRYGQHHQVNLESQQQSGNSFWIKDQEEEQVAEMLLEWRQHIAKMRDINSEEVLSYQTLSTLAKTRVNSILQISQICSSHQPTFSQGVYSLSLQQFQQIFQLFQLHKQQKQQSTHELIIPKRLPYYKANQQKPIKELFQQLKFTDVGNDWLNKKTDESVRLYKEILSINEFDNSVVEEYLKESSQSHASSSSLSIQDINRYVKYAEYLRLGNHKRLQQLYEKSKGHNNSSGSSLKEEEYFEENFIQGQEYKDWDEIESQLNFPTMDTINQPRSNESLTSLKNLTNLDIKSCRTLINMKSTSTVVLKQKKMNSLHLLESPSIFNKIEPLPENIEAIYLQAAKAKKNYVSKGQKKNSKASKKQSKMKVDTNSKKEEEFIPKKEDIFNLIYH